MRDIKLIERIMENVPKDWHDRWCEATACACMGCVNRAGDHFQRQVCSNPLTKEEWLLFLNKEAEEHYKNILGHTVIEVAVIWIGERCYLETIKFTNGNILVVYSGAYPHDARRETFTYKATR